MIGKARVIKIVHEDGTKISTFTFLTLDADIANDVFKG